MTLLGRTAQCWRCGGWGHRAQQCPSPEDTCRKCGKTGHRAADCQVKPQDGQQQKQNSTQQGDRGKGKGKEKGKPKGKGKDKGKEKGKIKSQIKPYMVTEVECPEPTREQSAELDIWVIEVLALEEEIEQEFVVDTVAATCVVPKHWRQYLGKDVVPTAPESVVLRAAGGRKLVDHGGAIIKVRIGSSVLDFYVRITDVWQPILSAAALRRKVLRLVIESDVAAITLNTEEQVPMTEARVRGEGLAGWSGRAAAGGGDAGDLWRIIEQRSCSGSSAVGA